MRLRKPAVRLVLGTLIGVPILVLSLLLMPFTAIAAPGINKTINFQGKITNPNGTNVTDGNYEFDFALYTVSSGGSATWTETVNLDVADGIFQHNLGSSTALPGSVDFNTDNIYLGIQFNNDAAGEMSPRIRFTASPYSFNADNLDGMDASAFVQLSPGSPQTGFIDVSGNITSGATMIATTSLQAPLLDTASAVALAIGTNNATAISLNQNVAVAASKTLTVTSAATSLTGATSGVALTVSNSTSTGNIVNFNDNATTVFSIANGGAVLLQNTADSTDAFKILKLDSTALFTADTQNTLIRIATTAATTLSGAALITTNAEVTTAIRVGNATNGVEFSGATGPLYRGTGRPTTRATLVPEYAGAVLTGDGANNSGTMTSDICSGSSRKSILTTLCDATEEHNFYQWKSTSGTNDYDVFIRYQMPSNYDTQSITAINMYGYRTTSSDSITLELYNAGGGQCGTTTTITNSDDNWSEVALANTGGDADCNSIAAGDVVIWKIHMTSSGSTNSALAGEIRYDYSAKF